MVQPCKACIITPTACPLCGETGEGEAGQPCPECQGIRRVPYATCADVTCLNHVSNRWPPNSDGH